MTHATEKEYAELIPQDLATATVLVATAKQIVEKYYKQHEMYHPVIYDDYFEIDNLLGQFQNHIANIIGNHFVEHLPPRD